MLSEPYPEFGQRASPRVLDVIIRLVLIGFLGYLCYRVLSPFLSLLAWSIILAVTLYPLHQMLARRIGGRQWLASGALLLVGTLLIVVPTVLLMNSFADTIRGFVTSVVDGTFQVPPPPEGIANWPIIGKTASDYWAMAYSDLPGLVKSAQPKITEIAGYALGVVASVGSSVLLFFASFVVAGILMPYGESGERTFRRLFERTAGEEKGASLSKLSVATIRTVALGVIGIAAIQAILVGSAMLIAGVPGAGVLAIITLILGIAQVPALVVSLPVIAYIWASGNYDTSSAVVYTIVLLLTGMADNVLKPIFLGRGVDTPMPVILIGALGGMATGGILGMFIGATALALGYEIFMAWLTESRGTQDADETTEESIAKTPAQRERAASRAASA